MKEIRAVYEKGVLRPTRKLPLREHAIVRLVIRPTRAARSARGANPVQATKGIFHLPKRVADILIYDDRLLES